MRQAFRCWCRRGAIRCRDRGSLAGLERSAACGKSEAQQSRSTRLSGRSFFIELLRRRQRGWLRCSRCRGGAGGSPINSRSSLATSCGVVPPAGPPRPRAPPPPPAAQRHARSAGWSACGLFAFRNVERGETVFVRLRRISTWASASARIMSRLRACSDLMQQRGAIGRFRIGVRAGLEQHRESIHRLPAARLAIWHRTVASRCIPDLLSLPVHGRRSSSPWLRSCPHWDSRGLAACHSGDPRSLSWRRHASGSLVEIGAMRDQDLQRFDIGFDGSAEERPSCRIGRRWASTWSGTGR